MKEWDSEGFENYLQPKPKFAVALGALGSGKTGVAKLLEKNYEFELIDL